MAGNPGKKPHVELRRPPPNADSFVNQGAALPPVYASFPVAPPGFPPVAPAIPEAPAPVPAEAPPSVPASAPVVSEVRKATPVVAQEDDEEADLEAEEDEEPPKPAPLQRLAAPGSNSEDEGRAIARSSPAEVEPESSALVPASSKGRTTRKSKGNSKAVVQRVSGRQLRRTTIYFDVELARTLAIYCASTDREMSEVVSIAVKQFLKKNPL